MNSCRSSGAPSKSSSAAIISACQLIRVISIVDAGRSRSSYLVAAAWPPESAGRVGEGARCPRRMSAFDGPAREAGHDLPVGEDVGNQGRDRDEQDVHEQQVVEAQVLALEGEQGELDRRVLVSRQEVERAGEVVEDEDGLNHYDRHDDGS